jgi:hypothetical protein
MKKIVFMFLSAIAFYSCHKDPKDPPPNCTTSVASIAGDYKITAATYKESATSPEADYMNELFPDPCQRDNLYTFKTDGSYQIADVGLVCSPPDNDNGTWSLLGTTNLQIDGDPTILESFDCKLWIIANTDIIVNGDKLKLTLTKQ